VVAGTLGGRTTEPKLRRSEFQVAAAAMRRRQRCAENQDNGKEEKNAKNNLHIDLCARGVLAPIL